MSGVLAYHWSQEQPQSQPLHRLEPLRLDTLHRLEPLHRLETQVGIDEAGRGCLLGPVFAAAVVWDPSVDATGIKDSKKLTPKKRKELRTYIESNAIAYGVGSASHVEIDEHNILNATYLAMHRALDEMFANSNTDLHVDRLVVDGDRFKPYNHHRTTVPFVCVRGGDNKYVHVAAASILAKENHDDWIETHFADDLRYNLTSNKGYGTKAHRDGIREYGLTDHHRKTFCKFAR